MIHMLEFPSDDLTYLFCNNDQKILKGVLNMDTSVG